MSEVEVKYDEINDAYGIYHNGELQGSVITHNLAQHLVQFFEKPRSPRAQVVQIIEDLVSDGFTRPEAIEHVLTNPDYRSLLKQARRRHSKNPTATRQTIYNWLREHNRESHR